ncbi:MAG: glutamate racemase [Pseudomonadota bacterium]
MTFDSGFGGLSVLRHLVKELPDHNHLYVTDLEAFPYGEWEAGALKQHLLDTIGQVVEVHNPALVTIACNTASTLVLSELRSRHAIPFVGTVPAVKPAAEITITGLISVLATPATVERDYTRDLIERFAEGVSVTCIGAPRLAQLAEDWLKTATLDEEAMVQDCASAFIDNGDGRRTDTIVLACTHYPLLSEALARTAPWPVQWIDPGSAIARHAVTVVHESKIAEGSGVLKVAAGGDIPHENLKVWLKRAGVDPDRLRCLDNQTGIS